MIKQARRRFVIWSMTAFFVILAVIMTTVNILNYNSVKDEADTLLGFIADNKGTFPQFSDKKPSALPPGMSPEVPYESRFFSVTASADGDAFFADTGRIASIDQDSAVQYAKDVLKAKKETGFYKDFRFLVKYGADDVRIIFLDCGRRLNTFYTFMWSSIAISAFGYAVVFLLIAVFSRRIVRPIAESYEKQKRFITDAGHEIKTPLTVIHTDADLLLMEDGDNEWLRDIKTQADRLTKLTNELIYLSRMEENGSSITPCDIVFSDLLKDVSAPFIRIAQNTGKSFECRIASGLTMKGDPKALEKLISQLLDNALKYSPMGGRIVLSAEKQNKNICFSVYNTASCKIEKDSLDLLFDRFYRADPSRSSRISGHGIGLSVAKAIVSAHGGRISASSDDGTCLQITVTLPA